MVEHFCVKFNVPSYSGFLRYRVEKNRCTDGEMPLMKTLPRNYRRHG